MSEAIGADQDWIIERGRNHSDGGHAIILHSTHVAANWSFVTEGEFERYVADKEALANSLRTAWDDFRRALNPDKEGEDE